MIFIVNERGFFIVYKLKKMCLNLFVNCGVWEIDIELVVLDK